MSEGPITARSRTLRRAAGIGLRIALVAWAVSAVGPAAAQGRAADLRLEANAGLGGVAKPGRWLPVTVVIANARGEQRGELVVSWGDAVVRRPVAFAAPGTRRFTVYLRTADPESTVRVVWSGESERNSVTVEAPVQVLSHSDRVTVCVAPADAAIASGAPCSMVLAAAQLPGSLRAYDVVDAVIAEPGSGASLNGTPAATWQAMRRLEDSGDLALTPQVTRPMLRRGLPWPTAQSVVLLAAFYAAALIGLGAAAASRRLSPSGIWASLAVLIGAAGAGALAIGDVGATARTTVYHESLMQQLPGTAVSLITLRGVAEFPSNDAFELRLPMEHAMLEAAAASGRAEQRLDDSGFPVLTGRFGLGERHAFSVEAAIESQWLQVTAEGGGVRVTNRSPFVMQDCRFAEGVPSVAGELQPGASVSSAVPIEAAGPLFECTVLQPAVSFVEPTREVRLVGRTRVVVYQPREDRLGETPDA